MSARTRILLVDDDTLVLRATKMMLNEAEPDWQIDLAESAEAALARKDLAGLTVAVIDYNLPGQDGLDLVKQLKLRAPDVPIIFLTGRGSERVAREAFRLGVTDYVIKSEPGSSQSLLEACRRARDEIWTAERLTRLLDQDLPFGLMVVNPETLRAERLNQSARRALEDLGFGRFVERSDKPRESRPAGQVEIPAFVRQGLQAAASEQRLVGRSGMIYQIAHQTMGRTRTAGGQPYALFLIGPDRKPIKPREPLSGREREVLDLVLEGSSNAAIGEALFISEVTVKAHVSRLLRKFGLDSRAQLVARLLGSGGTGT